VSLVIKVVLLETLFVHKFNGITFVTYDPCSGGKIDGQTYTSKNACRLNRDRGSTICGRYNFTIDLV
jgi:hypothetical protein